MEIIVSYGDLEFEKLKGQLVYNKKCETKDYCTFMIQGTKAILSSKELDILLILKNDVIFEINNEEIRYLKK